MSALNKFYLTFGQTHIHKIGCKVFDKDCVALIEAKDYIEARRIANDCFGQKWSWLYSSASPMSVDADPDKVNLSYYPRGIIKLD